MRTRDSGLGRGWSEVAVVGDPGGEGFGEGGRGVGWRGGGVVVGVC